MSHRPFVHLHVHTEYSKLDGLSQIEDIVRLANEYNQPAVAVTDHGSLAGWAPLFRICSDKSKNPNGVKPIPGLEAYQVPNRFSQDKADDDGKLNFHLILLAYNETGYYNLQKINGRAWNESLYRRYGSNYARVDTELIREHSEGIMATTGCIGSMVNQALLRGNRQKALEYAQEMVDILGKENYFVEIQNHHMKAQLDIIEDQVWLARELGVKIVATNDSHYNHYHDEISGNDAAGHQALLCVGTGSSIQEPRFKFESEENWFRTGDEMYELFDEDWWHEACDNTLEIASRVDVPSPFERGYFMPEAKLPDNFDGDANDYLRKVVFEDMEKYHNGDVPQENIDQANFELDVIKEMNFPNYFLLTSEIIKEAKSRGIRIGPGRGSGAGSIVAFHIHITTVHPMDYGLYFERFLNPARKSMPDFDIDVAQHQREDFIQMLVEMYGHDRIAHIATYQEMKPKSLINNVGRAMELSVQERNELKELYPEGFSDNLPYWLFEDGLTSSDLDSEQYKYYRAADSFRNAVSQYSVDIEETVNGELRHRTVPMSHYLSGLSGKKGNIGIHAGGILITPGPVYDLFPVRINDKNGRQECEFDKKDLEATGGLKMDFLGLRNLSLVELTEQLIRQDLNMPEFKIDEVPMDDEKTYSMIASGENDGVFQLNSPKIQDWIRSMKPDSFWDISALSALNRPGPMGTGAHKEYAERKNGRAKITYDHPELEGILGETYGLIVYQEQVMEIARHFAGYTMAEADNFRRIMGAKNAEAMGKEKVKFIDGFASNGYTESLANKLWDTIAPFAEYAFNKAHTVAYGFISFQTAYLKCNYPAQYAAAGFIYGDSMPQQVEYCRNNGVHLFPPNVNVSRGYSTTTRDSVWLGLSSVLNWDDINAIISEREENGNFESIGDFAKRILAFHTISRTSFEKLIQVGAFDTLHHSRKAMIENLGEIISSAKIASREDDGLGSSLFDFSEDESIEIIDDVAEAVNVINSYTDDYSKSEKIAMEVNLLGFFTGEHPFVSHQKTVRYAKSNGIIPEDALPASGSLGQTKEASVYGVLMSYNNKMTKAKRPFANFTIETGNNDSLDGVIFGKHLDGDMQGRLVITNGEISQDNFTENLQIKANSIEVVSVSNEELDAFDDKKPAKRRVRKSNSSSNIESTAEKPIQRKRRGGRKEAEEQPAVRLSKSYIFNVSNVDSSIASDMREMLDELPTGDCAIKLLLDNCVIDTGLRLDIIDDDASDICVEFGISYEIEEVRVEE